MGPEQIFLDERVVSRMADQPSPDANANEIRYIRDDVVKSMLQQSAPPEFFIQILAKPSGAEVLLALTNFGRIFKQAMDGGWHEIPGPDLTAPDPE